MGGRTFYLDGFYLVIQEGRQLRVRVVEEALPLGGREEVQELFPESGPANALGEYHCQAALWVWLWLLS